MVYLLDIWSHVAIWLSKVREVWLELGDAFVGILDGLLAVGGFLESVKILGDEWVGDKMLSKGQLYILSPLSLHYFFRLTYREELGGGHGAVGGWLFAHFG